MSFSDFPNLISAASNISDGNMSYILGDPKQAFKNRQDYMAKHHLNLKDAVITHLLQESNIVTVTTADQGNAILGAPNNLNADAMITNQPGIILMILTADCHAISLYDPKHLAIALIHAGRPGLQQQIIQKTIDRMHQEFGTNPADLLASFSPAIGPCCYKPAYPDKSPLDVKPHIVEKDGEYSMDIWTWATDQLKAAGVLDKNLKPPSVCNYHQGNYFSYRKSQNEHIDLNYRFVTTLGLKP